MSERGDIAAAVTAGLRGVDPALPIQQDPNLPFAPPTDRSWARISFQEGGKSFVSVGGAGGNLERGPLLAYVDIFTPLGSGDGEATALGAGAENALRRLNVGASRFERFQGGPEGVAGGEWRKQIVAVFSRSVRV